MKFITYLIGLLSSMSFISGWTFSLMYWPGGNQLATYGLFSFAFIFLPLLLFTKEWKTSKFSEKAKINFGVTSIVMIAISVAFKMGQLQGADIIFLIGAGLLILGFLPFFFFGLYKKSIG